MLGCHSIGAVDCITAVMSDVQQYNMHMMHIKTPHKHIFISIYKHTIKKREPKANGTGMDWTELNWTILDWYGLGWTGLDWTGLDWTGL